ncbi:MAG: hypothetical protein DMF72_02985 [Acidobacteria bacterium]|nr:MAG: hypothetical protein DMF72_02985 [Acidobacteriota bacterium]
MPTKTIRVGDTTKPDPFTVAIIANPYLEAPWNSGTFVPDPIRTNQPAFDSCVNYIVASLFGGLAGQAERLLGDLAIAPKVRVLSVFDPGVPSGDQNSLVAQDGVSNLLVPRRDNFKPFLAQHGVEADVAYAVSLSQSHTRASAWFTTDDDAGPGNNFTLDGKTFSHRHRNITPGTIAIHSSATSMTAVHEFGHALSSYSNGAVLDLYVDSKLGLNNKRGRPIPASFATYDGVVMASDPIRDSLGYPVTWQSYHCELITPAFPALMDNYWMAPGGIPEHCQHDRITRQFLMDRVRAKISR